EELVRVPAGRQRPGLGLAVTDDAEHDEIRVVERRTERMDQRVAQLATLVDRAWRFGGDVAADPARKRELAEQLLHARLVQRERGVDLAGRALEVRVCDRSRTTVAGPDDP